MFVPNCDLPIRTLTRRFYTELPVAEHSGNRRFICSPLRSVASYTLRSTKGPEKRGAVRYSQKCQIENPLAFLHRISGSTCWTPPARLAKKLLAISLAAYHPWPPQDVADPGVT